MTLIYRTLSSLVLMVALQQTAMAQRAIVPAAPTLVDRFPKKSGSLRATAFSFPLGSVKNNAVKSDTLFLYNESDHSMSVKVVGPVDDPFKLPADLSFAPSEFKIPAYSEAFIILSVDGRKATELGFSIQRVRLLTDDKLQALKELTITSNIEEYFPPMSAEDSSQVQKARVSSTALDYGKVRAGETATVKTHLCNDGKRELAIRGAKSPLSVLTVSFSNRVVQPADSVEMLFRFDTKGMGPGKSSQELSVFLNDPAMPELRFKLSGEIVK